ncbi:uncharacterized protein N7479_011274 [Penicillium vulpinum]|uniref:Uncharacterized protein n=1 Tax=Penicillium vulpinum TaxID=29845 RepID=A0A1V6RXM7_9EURO|nr:uncharacterized protein N7479_011274 [Penicillium vulpinum]KAJ5952861.1 hypothetical protein N7479_011274 [Penicillium vulpinum]OQE06338.1 hypothetical protein PENVUL_c018G01061 [Penicillium vulpinum]
MFSRNVCAALRRTLILSNHLARSYARIQYMSSRVPRPTMVTSMQTNEAYAPFAHYSQAIKAAGQVWLSGQIPADAQGNLIKGTMTEQTQAIIKNTEAILNASGSGLDRVVKVVVYVKDASVMPEFASVYDPAFPHRPARSMVEVSRLPAGVDIQVDFIAVI